MELFRGTGRAERGNKDTGNPCRQHCLYCFKALRHGGERACRKCFVLIDLKTHKLTYQDIGQIDFYVKYFEENIKTEGDNPTIGIVLCSEKNETMVKYSVLNENDHLYASKYKLYMPTEEELKKEIERERFNIEQRLDDSDE